jgi:DNA sulfur modification protein DndE
MSLAKLQNTTIMSSELTHSRLKYLATKIGVTEDIVSRLALGVSIREGKISEDWKPKENKNENLQKVNGGKSLRGKTLFKNELALWMILLSKVEGKLETVDSARTKFILHWERGIELISNSDNGSDWIHLINELYSNNSNNF